MLAHCRGAASEGGVPQLSPSLRGAPVAGRAAKEGAHLGRSQGTHFLGRPKSTRFSVMTTV